MIQSLLSWFLLLVWLIPILLCKSTAQPFIPSTGSTSHLSLPDLHKPHVSLAQPITSSQASLGGSNLKSEALLDFLPCPRLFSSPLLMSPCNRTQTCHHVLLKVSSQNSGMQQTTWRFSPPTSVFLPRDVSLPTCSPCLHMLDLAWCSSSHFQSGSLV